MSAAPAAPSELLLDVKDVVVEYPGKGFRAKPFQALKGVSLDIRPGETVGLVGESGSGKTTIGRAVLGLVRPSGGSIRFESREIAGLQGICLSTVRTHIKNVRQKTGSSSIREVVHRVSRMPQIVSALRMS